MPIRKEWKAHYGWSWRKIIRPLLIRRANDCCEHCGRPNKSMVLTLPKGLWYDEVREQWRAPNGVLPADLLASIDYALLERKLTQCGGAHLDNDPQNSDMANLAWLCRRCHLIHDKSFHRETRITRKDGERPILQLVERTG